MANVKYKQCTLKKGNTQKVSWIPSKYAKLNKILKLKRGDVWTDGWEVISVSTNEVDEKILPDSHNMIKSHRKRTGDANPKK